jgi:lipoprotein-anchoring transpeptidase ErfK/SrfK
MRLAALSGALIAGLIVFSGPAQADYQPTDKVSYAARVLVATNGYSKPGFNQKITDKVKPVSAWNRSWQQLLILDSMKKKNQTWIKVRLSRRPNTAQTWIPANRTRIYKNHWRIEIDRSRKIVRVFYKGKRITRFPAVVGARQTPTPLGLFAIYEKVRQTPADGFIGPIALHLTAHSNVLDNYGGGPGRVAIHGRGGASFLDPLGTARSHGCVRINNRRVKFMANKMPLGTPVIIRK